MTRLMPPLRYVSAKDSNWAFSATCIEASSLRVYSVGHLATLDALSDRWPARRSAGGDAALWVAFALLFLAIAALVLGGSREPGVGMLLMCVLAAVLAALGNLLLVWAIGYQRLGTLLFRCRRSS